MTSQALEHLQELAVFYGVAAALRPDRRYKLKMVVLLEILASKMKISHQNRCFLSMWVMRTVPEAVGLANAASGT